MRASTKKALLWVGGGAAVLGAVALARASQSAPATPAVVPAGTPVTQLVKGQRYTIAALLPPGVDQATLVAQLTNAGWSNIAILALGGSGQPIAGVTVPVGGYAATATWNGASGPVPTGVVAVTA